MAENPPAFPSEHHEPIRGGGSYRRDIPGMSLRDYFAGQALAGLLVRPGGLVQENANLAYRYADAMLAERDRQP